MNDKFLLTIVNTFYRQSVNRSILNLPNSCLPKSIRDEDANPFFVRPRPPQTVHPAQTVQPAQTAAALLRS